MGAQQCKPLLFRLLRLHYRCKGVTDCATAQDHSARGQALLLSLLAGFLTRVAPENLINVELLRRCARALADGVTCFDLALQCRAIDCDYLVG